MKEGERKEYFFAIFNKNIHTLSITNLIHKIFPSFEDLRVVNFNSTHEFHDK